MIYNEFTSDDLVASLKEIYKKPRSTNPITLICNSKISKIIEITNEEISGIISSKEANLKRNAAMANMYLYPNWNYLKYPEVDLYSNRYINSTTNEQFESIGEDEYGDDILIYIRRV